MRKIFIISLSLLFSLNIYAQNNDKAKAILSEVSAKTKSYSAIKIEFTYKMENKSENINESKDGVIFIKGDKYWLNIAGQTVISDGKTVWAYIEDSEEVTINNTSTEEDALSPTKLLTSYDKNFKPKLIREAKEGSIFVQIIDLTPNVDRSYYKVRLTIDKAKKQIMSAAIHDKNGSIYTYKVNTFSPNINVSESKFVFKASDYPGVEVIDMR